MPWKPWKRKEEEKEEKPKEEKKDLLEELSESYEIPYSVLSITLPPDPRGRSIQELEKEGKDREKKDPLGARMRYLRAGGAALYKGDIELIKKYFGKCVELTSPSSEYRESFEYLTKEENIKKVVRLAKEFYAKTLKPEEEKKA